MGISPRLPVLLILVLLITSGCTAPSAPLAGPPVTDAVAAAGTRAPGLLPLTESPATFPKGHSGIQFEGDVDVNCSLLTVHALDLLDAKVHDAFVTVQQYIGVIECRDNWSAMYAWEDPPRFAVGRATREAGTVWYAGAIAHDSCHSRQYNDYAKVHPGVKVPEDLFSGQAAEEECIRYQYRVLENLGAPPKMLAYVANSSASRYWETTASWW